MVYYGIVNSVKYLVDVCDSYGQAVKRCIELNAESSSDYKVYECHVVRGLKNIQSETGVSIAKIKELADE